MKTYNIPEFKVRCSGISDIMSNGRAKDSIGETCKTFLKNYLIEQITGSRREISTKEIEKGIWCEGDAIALAGKHFNWFMAEKNAERKTNNYITGEADVVLPTSIVDIKVPWDVLTFPNFSREIPIKGYEQQLQGYMELWDKPTAMLCYVLMPTPEDLLGYSGCAEPACGYASWELSERIRSYEIERDRVFMANVAARVIECRKLIETELIPELEEWKKIKILIKK